ncbi:hypothetical protein CSB11_00675 [Candidatus Campbellbacteria bacterium]|nr:MAG: hypothetical protein CSB11_00675 [Candidatus Campbellbacteria bacterium]
MSVEIFQKIMASAMIFIQVMTLLFVIMYFFKKEFILNFFKKHGAKIGFFMVLLSIVGCSIFTEVYGIASCKLCWFQRLLMWPSIFLFAGAWFWKDVKANFYVLAMSLVGICISIYQWFVQNTKIFPEPKCSIDSVSCTEIPFMEFGYITPVVILGTMFLVLILTSYFTLKGHKLEEKNISE